MEAFVFSEAFEGCGMRISCKQRLEDGSNRQRLRSSGKRIRKSIGFGRAALGQVFAAAAASAEFGHGFFQERAHVVRLPGGLGED